MDKLREESNKLSQKDKGKSFSEIFTEEMATAKLQNDNRKRSDLWTSGSVDWYKTQIAEAERLRDIEKQAHIEAENARKAKYAAADATPEIKDAAEIKDAEKGSKSKSKSQYNDSSLAKIGGGGLTATRYDVAEKQLNESKKQSKLLSKIAENTEKQNSDMREIIMR